VTFNDLRQYGVRCLPQRVSRASSPGWRRLVLSNCITGVQFATTQPFRIDDAVNVENEWGKVEEITPSYA